MRIGHWRTEGKGKGYYHIFDRARLRAIVEHRVGQSLPWTVIKIIRKMDGTDEERIGSENFATYKAARDYVTRNPGVWGDGNVDPVTGLQKEA